MLISSPCWAPLQSISPVTGTPVGASVAASVAASVGASVSASVGASVMTSVGASVMTSVGGVVSSAPPHAVSNRVSATSMPRILLNLDIPSSPNLIGQSNTYRKAYDSL